MVARPIAESWIASFAVHSTVLSQAVVATEFKSVGPPRQTLNLMGYRNRLKICWCRFETCRMSFCYRKMPWRWLMNGLLACSSNTSWPSGYHHRLKIWWATKTESKSVGVGSKPAECHFAILIRRVVDSWTVFSGACPTVLSRAVITTDSKSGGSSQQTWNLEG